MRTLITLLFVALLPATALADNTAKSCRELKMAESTFVSAQTPGYRAVTVELEVSVSADTDVGSVAKKATYAFGMYTDSTGVRRDRDGMLRGIIACKRDAVTADGRLFPAGTVWLGVRAFVEKENERSYTLATTIVLPEKVVNAKPRAETMLRSGVNYRGTWADDGSKLSFAPVD